MINKYIKQEYIQSKHTCTCITELNKINMTKIKGLHRFDATFNNMLLHMISAREPTALRDDIWMRTETGYDMKNVMLWSLYHILQNSFPEIHDVACNKLTNIDRRADIMN
jgi:hypothetical protein